MAMLIGDPDTSRYKVVQGHFYPLVLHFEQDLAKIAAKLFERGLISATSLEEASNSNQPVFDRSSALLMKVLRKIEISQTWYNVFVSVLQGMVELYDISSEIEKALKLDRDSVTQSEPSKADSRKVLEGSLLIAEDPMFPQVRKDCTSSLSRHPSFPGGLSPPPHVVQVRSFPESCMFKRTVENKYLKSQTEIDASEISNLKQTVVKLEQERARCAEKLKQQGIVVSQKDAVIAELRELLVGCEGQITGVSENILANARAKLTNALLEKEREISKLREEFFKQERVKHELQLSKLSLQEERKVEQALKEKELAIRDREVAVKEKELAEEKVKRALEVAEYAKEEAKHANLRLQVLKRELGYYK